MQLDSKLVKVAEIKNQEAEVEVEVEDPPLASKSFAAKVFNKKLFEATWGSNMFFHWRFILGVCKQPSTGF